MATNLYAQDSNIGDSGNANVGIGITNPGSILSIYGAKSSSITDPLMLEVADTTAMAANVGGAITFTGKYKSDGSYAGMAVIELLKANGDDDLSGHLVFGTRNEPDSIAERVRITNSGNVGIGITNPTGKLTIETSNYPGIYLKIEKSSSFNPSSPASHILLNNADSSNDSYQGIAFTGNGGQTAGSMICVKEGTETGSSIKHGLAFYTTDGGDSGTTERLRIDNSGNTGIGTTSPSKLLHLYSSGGASSSVDTLLLQNYGTGTCTVGLKFASGTTAVGPRISGIQENSDSGSYFALAFDVRGTAPGDVDFEAMRINSLGNVGIGETSPGTLLELNGSAPYLTFKNDTHEDTDGGRESKIIFEGEQSGGEISTLAQIQASHDGDNDDERGKLILYTNAYSDGSSPTERMRINSSGYIGIGESIPLGILHVDGGTAAANAPGTNITIQSQNAGSGIPNVGGDILLLPGDGYYGGLHGQVGIGTASPNARCHIKPRDLAANSEIVTFLSDTLQQQITAAVTDPLRFNKFLIPEIQSNDPNNVTQAATVYIEGAPDNVDSATISYQYALWVDAGETRLDGDLKVGSSTSDNIGFFGTSPAAHQTVTGSKGGNAALASLLTALANYGLITDSST
ncbi:MAG: hypothetical protein ABIA63_12165 [bacterium]